MFAISAVCLPKTREIDLALLLIGFGQQLEPFILAAEKLCSRSFLAIHIVLDSVWPIYFYSLFSLNRKYFHEFCFIISKIFFSACNIFCWKWVLWYWNSKILWKYFCESHFSLDSTILKRAFQSLDSWFIYCTKAQFVQLDFCYLVLLEAVLSFFYLGKSLIHFWLLYQPSTCL